MVSIVLKELGDVVDLDSCTWPDAQGLAEDCLGVRQQCLHGQLWFMLNVKGGML